MSDNFKTSLHKHSTKIKEALLANTGDKEHISHEMQLTAMGELVGNIAHQWRQPLNAMTIIIQSIQMKSEQGTLSPEFIEMQVKEALRIANEMSCTIDDFRNFFQVYQEREFFNAKNVLQETIDMVAFLRKDEYLNISIEINEDLELFGYAKEFSQVFLNLINNARDNFKAKKVADNRKIAIKVSKVITDKPYALITFTDNGGGILPEIKERVFEPYFTTKHQSTGTGIGLYMTKQIIEKQMQGIITVKNIESTMQGDELYKCAQFLIAIPLK